MKQLIFPFVLAHGEGWEIVASRAVSDLVKKVLGEQHHTADQVQENGTFELHYTPSDAKMKTYKVPLPNPQKSPEHQSNSSPINNQQQTKFDDERFILQSKDTDINRF
jgi:hypothetical protein